MRIHVANITSFGRHTLDWYWSRDNELYVFVDLRSEADTLLDIRPTANEGNHGGVLILHDTAHGISKFENFDIEGSGYQAFLWEAKARSILVIAVC